MSLISVIHVAKGQLGMDDDTYRAFLHKTVGKKSCKGLNNKELMRVLDAMKAAGFKKQHTHKRKALVSDPQAKKIRAVWLMMANAGEIHNRSEAAIDAFVRRICGRGLESATVKQCQAVIECLKNWADRTEDKRIAEAFAAILAGNLEYAMTVDGKIVAEVQGGIQ